MGRFDVDLVGNYVKGADAVYGLRDAAKKQEAQDAYDSARKKAGSKIDQDQIDAQAALQSKEDSKVSVNNMPGQQVRELLSLRDSKTAQPEQPAQKPGVFSEPAQSGLGSASLVNQAIEGKQPALDGISQLPPKAEPAAAPYAPAGLAQAKQVQAPAVDKDLLRVKEHELTAKYLREKGQYDLAEAELEKATAAHGKYLTNTQAQRAQLAGGFARAIEFGNIQQATDLGKQLTGMVHDGHEIHSLAQNKDGTFSVIYGADANTKPVTVTKQQLIDLAKGFATPDINKHYEEVLKTQKFQSEINENNSTTRLNNAKASGFLGTGGGAKGEAAVIQVANRLMAEDDTLTFDQALTKAKAGSAKEVEVSFDSASGTTRIVDRANKQVRIYDMDGVLQKSIPFNPDGSAQQPSGSATPAQPAQQQVRKFNPATGTFQ